MGIYYMYPLKFITWCKLNISLNAYESTLLLEVLQSRIDEISILLESDNLESDNLEHSALISRAKFQLGQCNKLVSKISF